jgi:hypothetical protein
MIRPWTGNGMPVGAIAMQFDERKIGDYRVYAGALEGPRGDGYIAALIVQREQAGASREILRDESLACGHRWVSADAALAYAMTKARDVIRQQVPLLTC